MKSGSYKRWTEEDDNYIREHYPLGSIDEIAEHLNRTYHSVANRARALGVPKKKKRPSMINPDTRIEYREETECLADIICFMDRRRVGIAEIGRLVRCPRQQVEEILKRCINDGSYERYRKQENSHITGEVCAVFDFAVRGGSGRKTRNGIPRQIIVND